MLSVLMTITIVTYTGQKAQLSPRQFIAEDWHSYAIALPNDTKPITFGCEIKKVVGTRPFLLHGHFGDPKSSGPDADHGCKGDHCHLLVMGPFKTKSGKTYRASQSYLMQALGDLSQKYHTERPSSRNVGNINSYFRHLTQEPRKLMMWSTQFDSVQTTGFFEGYRWQEYGGTKKEGSKSSGTSAERDFKELQSLLAESRTSMERDFMTWAQALPQQTKDKINNKWFRRRDFSMLYQKCVQLLAYTKREYAWGMRLQQTSPDKKFMTLEMSKQLLIRWFRAQKFDITKFLTSLAQIMDQKINKINCFILTGESNSGKSIVARSILDAFKQEEVGEVYQGVQNNFMWKGCIGKRAILVEEVMMSSLSVESWKLMMEGTRPVMVAVKNSANQRLDPTPMIITCDALPWASCTIAKSL